MQNMLIHDSTSSKITNGVHGRTLPITYGRNVITILLLKTLLLDSIFKNGIFCGMQINKPLAEFYHHQRIRANSCDRIKLILYIQTQACMCTS